MLLLGGEEAGGRKREVGGLHEPLSPALARDRRWRESLRLSTSLESRQSRTPHRPTTPIAGREPLLGSKGLRPLPPQRTRARPSGQGAEGRRRQSEVGAPTIVPAARVGSPSTRRRGAIALPPSAWDRPAACRPIRTRAALSAMSVTHTHTHTRAPLSHVHASRTGTEPAVEAAVNAWGSVCRQSVPARPVSPSCTSHRSCRSGIWPQARRQGQRTLRLPKRCTRLQRRRSMQRKPWHPESLSSRDSAVYPALHTQTLLVWASCVS